MNNLALDYLSDDSIDKYSELMKLRVEAYEAYKAARYLMDNYIKKAIDTADVFNSEITNTISTLNNMNNSLLGLCAELRKVS